MCAMLTYVRLQRARDRNERRLAARKEEMRNTPVSAPRLPAAPKPEKPHVGHAERQAQRLMTSAKSAKTSGKRKSLRLAAAKWAARASETDEQRTARIEAEAEQHAAAVSARIARVAAIRAAYLLREVLETPEQTTARLAHGNRLAKVARPRSRKGIDGHALAVAVLREAKELRRQRHLASKTKRIRDRKAPSLPYTL